LNVQNPRFPLFDSLRAIAALSVLFFHVAFVTRGFTQPGFGRVLAQLNIGVPIFFLISGFLLYRPFAHARFSAASAPAVVPYAIRRLARIVPAYWVAVTLVALWLGLHSVFTLHGLLTYYGFTQVYDAHTLVTVDLKGGLGHTWTLCVEMSFYVLLPVWAFLQRRLPVRSTRQFVVTEALPLVAIFAAGLAWNYTQIQSIDGIVVFTPKIATLPDYLDHFALGMGLAVASVVLASRKRQPLPVRVVVRAPWVPWLVAAGAFVVLCSIGSNITSVDAEATRHVIRGFVALCVLLPAVFGDTEGGVVRRVLADRRLQWVGLVSYSLYLWHLPIVSKLQGAGVRGAVGWVGFAVVSVVACLTVAAVSFYVVERPFQRLARRATGRSGSQEPEPPTSVAGGPPGATDVELARGDRVRSGTG
jgi:peptidoglycan/LPS O-acetylase OafA/YrhL